MMKRHKHSEETKQKIRESRFRRKQLLGYINSPETIMKIKASKASFKKNHIPWNKGKHPKYMKENTFAKGHISWNKGKSFKILKKCAICKNKFYVFLCRNKKAKYCSKKCMGIAMSGINCRSWKGGITPLYEIIRKLPENKQWKLQIFKRDNYTCQECGDAKGGNLNAHHIKSFAIILKEFLQKYSEFSPMEDREILIKLAERYEPFWDISNGKTLCEKCHQTIKMEV